MSDAATVRALAKILDGVLDDIRVGRDGAAS